MIYVSEKGEVYISVSFTPEIESNSENIEI